MNGPAPDLLSPGTPAPRFSVAGTGGQPVAFDTLAGRYLVLGFVGLASQEASVAAITAMEAAADLFDGVNIALFWVGADPADEAAGRLKPDGARRGVLWDFDLAIAKAFTVVRQTPEGTAYRPTFIVLDPRLRVLMCAPIADAGAVIAYLTTLPPAARYDGDLIAPVLIVPRLFSPEVCASLIKLYDEGTPVEGGFMRQVEGKTVRVLDPLYKKRSDIVIAEGPFRNALRDRISFALVPEVERAFQFSATRIERYIVACYDAASGGYFKPHRDNTTTGTAHRKFAVTINLNAEDYEGGDLRFPEFGGRSYRAPTGGAIVFSCALQHEALPVTRGRRYAFLPFLYDEAGAKVREANMATLGGDIPQHEAS